MKNQIFKDTKENRIMLMFSFMIASMFFIYFLGKICGATLYYINN